MEPYSLAQHYSDTYYPVSVEEVRRHLVTFTVDSNRMHPRIRQGARLMAMPATREELTPGTLVAVQTRSALHVGRVAINDEALLLTFDNLDFEPMEIDWSEVEATYTRFGIIQMSVD